MPDADALPPPRCRLLRRRQLTPCRAAIIFRRRCCCLILLMFTLLIATFFFFITSCRLFSCHQDAADDTIRYRCRFLLLRRCLPPSIISPRFSPQTTQSRNGQSAGQIQRESNVSHVRVTRQRVSKWHVGHHAFTDDASLDADAVAADFLRLRCRHMPMPLFSRL